MSATRDSAVRIGVLFPDLLGTYGDGGNAVVLAQRLAWRGIPVDVVTVAAGQAAPDSCDLYLVGGGEDGPPVQATRELAESRALHRAVDAGAAVLAVCAGMQILGHRFPDASGVELEYPARGHSPRENRNHARVLLGWYALVSLAVGATQAPDLRRSAVPQDRATFLRIVRGGELQPLGMPKFAELSDRKLEDIRYYIRAQAAQLRGQATAGKDTAPTSLNIR